MRPAWRRVAHWADRQAFAPEEVSEAILSAVEDDCRREIRPEFIAEIRQVVAEPSLFAEDTGARLDALRPNAAAGLERRLLDGVCFLSESEAASFETIQAALGMAARRCAETRALQIEEHFVRRSELPRVRDMRGRLDSAIDLTNFTNFAARMLSVDPRNRPAVLAKHIGLDDGVKR
jgi:hypothetical protein